MRRALKWAEENHPAVSEWMWECVEKRREATLGLAHQIDEIFEDMHVEFPDD